MIRKGGYVIVLAVVAAVVCGREISKEPREVQERFVAAKLAEMTLADKVGQMTQGEAKFYTAAQAAQMRLGSLLNGGGSPPPSGNRPENWADQYDEYQRAVLGATGVPLIYGQDAVHGINNVEGATVFPHNIGLGCMADAGLMAEMGAVVSEELLAAGMTWAFTPCVAAARDDRWGRTYESFSEHPGVVANMTRPFVAALQRETVYGPRAIGCAKHFMADGGAEFGTGRAGYLIDRGDLKSDEATLRRVHLPGYLAALEAGVGTVMASYSSWNGVEMHRHKYLLTDVLKTELGFDGFVISDYNAVWELPGSALEQVAASVNAGVDMMMVPSSAEKFIKLLTECVASGRVSAARIDDAVARILRIKTRFGLFDHPYSNRTALAQWGSPAHRAVARRAVQQSAVLLRNDGGLLPLNKSARVLVLGEGANDIGLQCGGWTIEWQGKKGAITRGTTIYDGIREVVEAHGGAAVYHRTGALPTDVDVAVLVTAEDPYAEGKGDSRTLGLRATDIATITKLRRKLPHVPVVAITLSGRPVIVTKYHDAWRAHIAAFLPGTEAGHGLADLLFGDVPFTGRLSFSWPKDVSQEPINYDDSSYNPLYPFGFKA